jgi:hypothetical protein
VGDYTVKFFNEECYGDYFTDFGSVPATIPMTVTLPVHIQNNFNPAVAVRRENPSPTDSAEPLSSPTLAESTIVGYAGHQWVVIGWNGAGVASVPGAVTLLLANADTGKPANSSFNSLSNQENTYAGSILQNSITSFYNGLPAAEKGYIITRDLTGDSGSYTYVGDFAINTSDFNSVAGSADATQYASGYYLANTLDWYAYHDMRVKDTGFIGSAKYTDAYHPDNVAGNQAAGQSLWPLSTAEACLLDGTIRIYNIVSNSQIWWLRSPGDENNYAAYVLGDSSVFVYGHYVFLYAGGVRPALYSDRKYLKTFSRYSRAKLTE